MKTINYELIYNRKYLKPEKKINTKESFQSFYIPVILFHSVHRKDGNYYQVILEKIFHNLFEKYKKFRLLGLWMFLLKYKKVPFPEM